MQAPSPLLPNPFAVTPEALAECAREPIHIPKHVQGLGVIVIFELPTGAIRQVSANCEGVLDQPPEIVLRLTLDEVVGVGALARVTTALLDVPEGALATVALLTWRGSDARPLTGLVHRHTGVGFLELLPHDGSGPDDLDRRIREFVLTLGRADNLTDYTRLAVDHLRALTGFDRSMYYQFDEHGHGEVVAESCEPRWGSYLGLRFPSMDIPANARRLLRQTRVQALTDVFYTPTTLMPTTHPSTGQPTDLTYCALRGISPLCQEFYRNMKVRSTLVLAVVHGDELVGLLVCHQHCGPKITGPHLRAACRFLSELISLQSASHVSRGRLLVENRVHQVSVELAQTLAHAPASAWVRSLSERGPGFLGLVGASGAALVHGQEVVLLGETPELPDVLRIVDWVRVRISDGLFATPSLPRDEPAFGPLADKASGVLLIRLSWRENSYVAWFRPEVLEEVRWAGLPSKVPVLEGGEVRLHPRQSFAEYRTLVRGTSRAWSASDRLAADMLRASLLGVVLDAVALRRALAERDLLRVRQAVEASSEAMAIFNCDGAALVVNPAFRRLFGHGPEPLTRPDDVARLFADASQGHGAAEALRRARDWAAETTLAVEAGTVPAAVRLSVVRDQAGEWAGHIGLFVDLSEQRRVQERLQQAQKLESLGVMAGGVAHDFNNLLTSILGHASLAAMHLPRHSPAGEGLGHIESAARQAADLCQQLLAYSGRSRVAVTAVDLNALAREMEPLMLTVISKSVRLRLELADGAATAMADPTPLRQVLMNLLINGAEAIGDANGEVRVRTATASYSRRQLDLFTLTPGLPEQDYISLEVTDNGCGMDEATASRIFDPFFSTKFTGRGLGLASVLGIIRSHGGGIRVVSQPGVGTTFTIVLPASPAAAERTPRPSAPSSVEGGGRLVLVVDDDPGVLRVAQAALRMSGFTVAVAHGGRACLEQCQRLTGICVVVLDLTMPDLSGRDVLQQLRTHWPDLPVLLSSGYVEEHELPTGANGFLAKPYRAGELLNAVRQVLGH